MNTDFSIIKYPRTPHIEGSRLQPGDEDLSQVPFSAIAGRHIVVEEKIDGANTAISFDDRGNLLLQSRGHYLTGGGREKHYAFFKKWACVQRDALYSVLGCRYVMYGEWMYAKHTVYYDCLPHYFMEFDVLDREMNAFLSTHARRKLLGGLPVASVPVLFEGEIDRKEKLLSLLGPSKFISENHLESLRQMAMREKQDVDKVFKETDLSDTMEGLYIKVEENGEVTDRVKFVRNTFLQTVQLSNTHWLERPILPNGISVRMDELYLPTLSKKEVE